LLWDGITGALLATDATKAAGALKLARRGKGGGALSDGASRLMRLAGILTAAIDRAFSSVPAAADSKPLCWWLSSASSGLLHVSRAFTLLRQCVPSSSPASGDGAAAVEQSIAQVRDAIVATSRVAVERVLARDFPGSPAPRNAELFPGRGLSLGAELDDSRVPAWLDVWASQPDLPGSQLMIDAKQAIAVLDDLISPSKPSIKGSMLELLDPDGGLAPQVALQSSARTLKDQVETAAHKAIADLAETRKRLRRRAEKRALASVVASRTDADLAAASDALHEARSHHPSNGLPATVTEASVAVYAAAGVIASSGIRVTPAAVDALL
jgi:hypothetical protein